MIRQIIVSTAMLVASPLFAQPVSSVVTPYSTELAADQLVLKNDSFVDGGGQAYLQMGFVENERAGVWVQVPSDVPFFKIEHFRVLIGSSQVAADIVPLATSNQVFFHMGIAADASASIPSQIENAASVTPGPYWNDIPAVGAEGELGCARAGAFIGAALEFAHTGLPSVYRDLDGISPKLNTLFAVPGGWNYSVAYGLRGDWILRVVGRKATAAECGA
jgi:hypothetical protein